MTALPDSASPADPLRLRVIISGQVQAVGFRAFVQEKAEMLGLTGWVRNRISGEVEVLAEGPRASLEDLLLYLRRGPRGARVSSVKTEWQPASGEFYAFNVVRTWSD